MQTYPMIEGMPGCCTSAILHSFGEHGEDSEVTPEKITKLIESMTDPIFMWRRGRKECVNPGRRCFFAISVSPDNIKIFTDYGFKIIDTYEGEQGTVHIMTFHV